MSSWSLVYAILANHRQPEDVDDNSVINRLWNEASRGKGPFLSEDNTTVVAEDWDLQRLAPLVQGEGETDLSSFPQHDPPVVVRWAATDFRIDGRRRINELVRASAPGPHTVLVLLLGSE
ncbi:hypothetical protein [Aquabacterium humicola]|uniref:hypothetical protein n=1 Tax=Aquabacterium humicola TaxID=3237377 RepID=UPI002543D3BC|nr:hypothetical protein [Rubrivivax pictus]